MEPQRLSSVRWKKFPSCVTGGKQAVIATIRSPDESNRAKLLAAIHYLMQLVPENGDSEEAEVK
jgi:hypothetical protein